MNELIWHPVTEEPEDKNCILWFITGNRKNSKIRIGTWNNSKHIYAWAYPILPNF